jgi:hypothetical protein
MDRPILALLLAAALSGPDPAHAATVAVETFTGTGVWNVVLPGAPDGGGGVDFAADRMLGTISFTPGSVTFEGQPVDFSGTEASWLANTYSGTTNTPVAAGPAVVPVKTNLSALGSALSAPLEVEILPLDLGAGFGANFFDIVPSSTNEQSTIPSWNSAVVPELNGRSVTGDYDFVITSVDPVLGIVDFNFAGTFFAEELLQVPTLAPVGLGLLAAALLGAALLASSRERDSGA